MDVGRATALGPEPLGAAAAPTAASAERPLFYSFGIDNKWDPDDVLGAMGFEVHSFDPTTIKRAAQRRGRALSLQWAVYIVDVSGRRCGQVAHRPLLRQAWRRAPVDERDPAAPRPPGPHDQRDED